MHIHTHTHACGTHAHIHMHMHPARAHATHARTARTGHRTARAAHAALEPEASVSHSSWDRGAGRACWWALGHRWDVGRWDSKPRSGSPEPRCGEFAVYSAAKPLSRGRAPPRVGAPFAALC